MKGLLNESYVRKYRYGGININITSFYTQEELQNIGLKTFGMNIFISRKTSIYGAENISLGSNIRIDDFCILSGHIQMGNNIHIAAYTALYGGKHGIFIDDFANLSSRVCVYSVSDDYSGESMTNPMIPEKYKKLISAPVHIEKHVIVGTTSVILPGTTLKEGSSFGGFSFINHDSEEWSLNVGIPFRKIRDRSKRLLELEMQFQLENKK